MDLYARLGISNTASDDEVRKAFRKLAQTYHPDKGNENSDAIFKEINNAHQILSDPKKRAAYDEFGEESLSSGFNADVARARKERSYQESLKEHFVNTYQSRFNGFGASSQVYESSQTIDFASAISGCKLRVSHQYLVWELQVPPGTEDGEKLRVPHVTNTVADLLLTIHVTPHKYFRRVGNNLSLDVSVTVGELYNGCQIHIPSPKGGGTLTIHPRTQAGTIVRVAGHGVGKQGFNGGMTYGDLYVRWIPVIPQDESPMTAQAVDQLSRAVGNNLRDGLKL